MLKMSLFVVEIVENSYIFFKTITRDDYCCCSRGKCGNGGGDPKGKNTNTTPDPKKMSTLESGMLRYVMPAFLAPNISPTKSRAYFKILPLSSIVSPKPRSSFPSLLSSARVPRIPPAAPAITRATAAHRVPPQRRYRPPRRESGA
jgi:hypothetical protein